MLQAPLFFFVFFFLLLLLLQHIRGGLFIFFRWTPKPTHTPPDRGHSTHKTFTGRLGSAGTHVFFVFRSSSVVCWGRHPSTCVCAARLNRQLTRTHFLILHKHFYHTCGNTGLELSQRRVPQDMPFCFENDWKRISHRAEFNQRKSAVLCLGASSGRFAVIPFRNDIFLNRHDSLTNWSYNRKHFLSSQTELLFCKKMVCRYWILPCCSCIFPFQNKSVVGW